MNCVSCDIPGMRVPPFVCVFPWGIPQLQSDRSLSCDHGLDYATFCENSNNCPHPTPVPGTSGTCLFALIPQGRRTNAARCLGERKAKTQRHKSAREVVIVIAFHKHKVQYSYIRSQSQHKCASTFAQAVSNNAVTVAWGVGWGWAGRGGDSGAVVPACIDR